MSFETEIGTHLANLLVEMVSLAEEGVSGFELDHVKDMDDFKSAKPIYKQKALTAYQKSFDKHEHEGQHSAHEHGMSAAREVFVRAKKNAKANNNRKFRDDAMSSMGLTKVKGAVSGKTYWESTKLSKEDLDFLGEVHYMVKHKSTGRDANDFSPFDTEGEAHEHAKAMAQKHGIASVHKIEGSKSTLVGTHRTKPVKENWQSHSGRPSPGGETESKAHDYLTKSENLKHESHHTDTGFDPVKRISTEEHHNQYGHAKNHYGHHIHTVHVAGEDPDKFTWHRSVGAGLVKKSGTGLKSLHKHLDKHPLPGDPLAK